MAQFLNKRNIVILFLVTAAIAVLAYIWNLGAPIFGAYSDLPKQERDVCESFELKSNQPQSTGNLVEDTLRQRQQNEWAGFDTFHRAMGSTPEFRRWKVVVDAVYIFGQKVVLKVHLPCQTAITLQNFSETPFGMQQDGKNPHSDILLTSAFAQSLGTLHQDDIIAISGNLVYVPQCSMGRPNYIETDGGCAFWKPLSQEVSYSLAVRYAAFEIVKRK